MSLYDVLLWISQLQLWGNRLNILAVFWIMGLTFYTYRQIKSPLNQLRVAAKRKAMVKLQLILAAVLPVILAHFLTDEMQTFLVIGLGYGPSYLGHLSGLWDLLAMKFDVYLSIIILSMLAVQLDLNTRFRFTRNWAFAFFFLVWFALHFYAAYTKVPDFALLQGVARVNIFWTYYPLSKGLLALVYISVLKRGSDP